MRRAPLQSSQSSTTPGARAHAQAAAPRHSLAAIPNRLKSTPRAPSVILPAAAPCRAAFPATTRPVISPCTAEHIAADHPLLVRAYASILDRMRHGTERPSAPLTGRRGDGCAGRTVSTRQSKNGQCGPQTTALYAPPPPFPLPLRLTAWSSPSQSPCFRLIDTEARIQ
ncbi:hypothetical protein B0H11DRAFT_1956143 [Mycena galericulata]|nr:hypothetical protein B0H11DRAFT_1956143 [Mycena galericulata]